MSIIAIANNYLYADRKVLMSGAITTIYKMFHDVPENRGRQFIHELKCCLNNPEYFEKST